MTKDQVEAMRDRVKDYDDAQRDLEAVEKLIGGLERALGGTDGKRKLSVGVLGVEVRAGYAELGGLENGTTDVELGRWSEIGRRAMEEVARELFESLKGAAAAMKVLMEGI